MPNGVSVQIPEYDLRDLFLAYQVFERIRLGDLVERRIEPIRSSKRCSLGGESFYLRAYESSGTGREVARIHYLRCAFGHIIGVFPSHIVIGGVLLYRRGHQRRPQP